MDLFQQIFHDINKNEWITHLSTRDLWRLTLTNKYLYCFVTNVIKSVHSVIKKKKWTKYPLRSKYCYYSINKDVALSTFLLKCICKKLFIYELCVDYNVCYCRTPNIQWNDNFCWDCICRIQDEKCYQCYHDDKYTCNQCKKIGCNNSFFSYSKVCWDCDIDSNSSGCTQCNCCHRAASEYYDGSWYCDWCI